MTPVHPKVAAGGTAGAAALVLVWCAGQAGVDLSPEVAGAFVVVATSVAGWFRRADD